MAQNYILRRRTQERIDERVERLLNRLGNPEPRLKLEHVRDALSLGRAFFLPDEKRILINDNLHKLKYRWIEAHEVGHSLLPWHEGAILGDNAQTLQPNCHTQMEAEANFAAARLLFLRDHNSRP